MPTEADSPKASSWGALAGLKVVDLSWALAGPFGTQVLADMGATVIKIEGSEGDFTRAGGPFHPSDKERRYSGYFQSVNRNKTGIQVNLKSEEGRQVVLDLVKDADVVVENFRAGVMERLGLSYEFLQELNPRLIYATLRGFGDARTGASPYGDWPALDVVAQAMGGLASVTGPDADHPTKVGPGVGDTVPGLYLAIGILSALYSRQNTGKGQFVDVAMVDCILAVSERIVYQRSFGKMIPGPVGNHQPNIAPFGFFPCKDGHVAMATTDQHQFELLSKVLNAPELLTGKFKDREGRRLHREELIDELNRYTRNFTKAELIEQLGGKIPFGPIFTIADIAADPHFAARDMLPELNLPGLDEPVSIAGVPIKMTGTPGGVHSPAPNAGQHTREVLRSLGYPEGRIDELVASGAVIAAN